MKAGLLCIDGDVSIGVREIHAGEKIKDKEKALKTIVLRACDVEHRGVEPLTSTMRM